MDILEIKATTFWKSFWGPPWGLSRPPTLRTTGLCDNFLEDPSTTIAENILSAPHQPMTNCDVGVRLILLDAVAESGREEAAVIWMCEEMGSEVTITAFGSMVCRSSHTPRTPPRPRWNKDRRGKNAFHWVWWYIKSVHSSVTPVNKDNQDI